MERWIPDGTVVGERWRIIGLLGAGGFGQVLLAEDVSGVGLGRAAIKVLHPNTTPQERQAFLHEVKKIAVLRHQNLVGYLDSGQLRFDGDELPDHGGEIRPYLVTELCQYSLHDRITAAPGGHLSSDETLTVLAGVAAGLAHLHERGLIHRDIKPGNVLFADGHWKLADFGLMRDLSATGSYHRGEFLMGTPLYMAPELFTTMTATAPSDVYAVGVLAHVGATGRALHTGAGSALVHNITTTQPSIDPTIDASLRALVERCTDPDPERRPSARQLAESLGQGGAPLAPIAPVPTPPTLDTTVATPGSADPGGEGFGQPAARPTEPTPTATTVDPTPMPAPSPTPTPGSAPGQGQVRGSTTVDPGRQPPAMGADGSLSIGGSLRRWPVVAGAAAAVVLLVAGAVALAGRLTDRNAGPASSTGILSGEALGDPGPGSGDDDIGDGTTDGAVDIGDGVQIGDGVDTGGTTSGDGGTAETPSEDVGVVAEPRSHFDDEPCGSGPGGAVRLTNRHTEPVDYLFRIDHFDGGGTKIDETIEAVYALPAGATAFVGLQSTDEDAASCSIDSLTATPTSPAALADLDHAQIESCILDEFFGNWYDLTYTVTNPTDRPVDASTAFGIVDADGVRIDGSFPNGVFGIDQGDRVRGETFAVFLNMDELDRGPFECVIIWNELRPS